MKIKGVIFDLDGTLVDSLSFWGYLWREIGIKYFNNEAFKPDEDIDKMVRTTVYVDAMTIFKEHYKLKCSTEEFIDFARNRITDFYKTKVKPKKGAIELLEYLKKNNFKICLASATARAELDVALTATKIKDYFSAILSCADIGVGKDKPDIYLESMKTLGLEASELCVIEDSCVALETAKKAGFHTIGVYDRFNYGHDRLRAAAEIYLDDGISLETLIEKFEV